VIWIRVGRYPRALCRPLNSVPSQPFEHPLGETASSKLPRRMDYQLHLLRDALGVHRLPRQNFCIEYRGSISSGHRPNGAELERMMIAKCLFSITIQHPVNPLYPVVKDEFQFRPLDFIQTFLNANEKILSPGELLPCQCRLHVPEKPKARRCQVGTVRWMGYSNHRIFTEKFAAPFERWT
jgi:hypothetical protein